MEIKRGSLASLLSGIYNLYELQTLCDNDVIHIVKNHLSEIREKKRRFVPVFSKGKTIEEAYANAKKPEGCHIATKEELLEGSSFSGPAWDLCISFEQGRFFRAGLGTGPYAHCFYSSSFPWETGMRFLFVWDS